MKTKTNELQGAALDWAVAESLGHMTLCRHKKRAEVLFSGGLRWLPCPAYSTNWSQGGPIIERENIYLCGKQWQGGTWIGVINCPKGGMPIASKQGDTALIAAMRCFVASKMGEEVEVPDELIIN